MRGFFSDSVWNKIKEPLSLVPQCGSCGLYKHCKSPKMEVTGKGRRKILVVAEPPGQNEDSKGKPLAGNEGGVFVQMLHNVGINLYKDCWIDSSLRCRPIGEGNGWRKPNNKELDYCRPNLAKAIEDLQPDVIVPLGEYACRSLIPLAWKAGEVEDITTWAGWQIPSQKLNAWICPMYPPSFVVEEEKNMAVALTVSRHLKAMEKLKGKPWPNGKPDYRSKVEVILDPEEAAKAIKIMACFNRPMAFDYETTCLKPDGPQAEILCCAVSDGITAIAYPWQGAAITATKDFLRSNIPKIAANLRFERRWTQRKLGIIVKNWWWDTLLGAHWLDCRSYITSLKFQAFVLFGIEDYDSHIDPYKKGKGGGGNTINRMKELEKEDLMMYCGLDSLFEVMVAYKQRENLK